MSFSLPNNFSYQIYLSDLPILFTVRNFYRSNLIVLFNYLYFFMNDPLSSWTLFPSKLDWAIDWLKILKAGAPVLPKNSNVLDFTAFTRHTGFILLTLSVIDHTQVTILTQSKLATYSVIFSWCACRWSELSLYKTTKQGKERKST